MARLVLTQLTKVYPSGNRAVADVTLDVPDGHLLTLVGPSGCGKTTLLRLIAGLETPTAGTITLGERSLDGLSPRERDVAMVFQGPTLYPHLNVWGNLAFPLRLRRMAPKEIDYRVRQTAALLGIERLLERKPRELSGGEQQRVALGRAIVRHPACFLMDEPLSHLDARLRDEMRTELKELHQRLGKTMIFVTHDQLEAMTLGESVAVMRHGEILQLGTPRDVYRHPSDGFVAGFLGSPPMNFLRGEIVVDQERWWFVHSGQRLAVPGWAIAELGHHGQKQVVLGIRPEQMREAPLDTSKDDCLIATIDLVEYVGNALHAHGSTNGTTLVARLDSSATATLGERKRWRVDLERVHFFAPPTKPGEYPGVNLCPQGERASAHASA